MIVEQGIHTTHPARAPLRVAAREAESMRMQQRILGHRVGCSTTEFGPLNQVIRMRDCESPEARARRRTRRIGDQGRLVQLVKVRPMIVSQESTMPIPAPFPQMNRQD